MKRLLFILALLILAFASGEAEAQPVTGNCQKNTSGCDDCHFFDKSGRFSNQSVCCDTPSGRECSLFDQNKNYIGKSLCHIDSPIKKSCDYFDQQGKLTKKNIRHRNPDGSSIAYGYDIYGNYIGKQFCEKNSYGGVSCDKIE